AASAACGAPPPPGVAAVRAPGSSAAGLPPARPTPAADARAVGGDGYVPRRRRAAGPARRGSATPGPRGRGGRRGGGGATGGGQSGTTRPPSCEATGACGSDTVDWLWLSSPSICHCYICAMVVSSVRPIVDRVRVRVGAQILVGLAEQQVWGAKLSYSWSLDARMTATPPRLLLALAVGSLSRLFLVSRSIGVEVEDRTHDAPARRPLPSLRAISGTSDHTCLRSMHVSLRPSAGDSDANVDKCEGYLIRDDIILTTRACSQRRFSIGFLSARVPHHYQFLSQPVRRARAFLSSVGSNSTTEVGCDETTGKPLIHHIEVGGQRVHLGHLRSVLPGDVLWDQDLKTAVELSNGSDQLRWYARPTTRSNETERMKRFFEKYSGPYGSIDIVHARNTFELKSAAIAEAEDPKGHRRNCFKYYFLDYWREEPFSGMTYFDWLDYSDQGRSKYIHKKPRTKCSEKFMANAKIHFFSDEEKEDVAIRIEPAGEKLVARFESSGNLLRPTANCEPYLYIFDLQRNLYVVDESFDSEKYGKIKHTALSSGRPVLAAGSIFVGDNGSIQAISFDSGHYHPWMPAAAFMHRWMDNQGLNTSAIRLMGHERWKSTDCNKLNWTSVDIEGFDGKLLDESCNEISAKISWPVAKSSSHCLTRD
ncbi:hypothetical protein THAOC_05670, partial [Thalassiosira oceanica]